METARKLQKTRERIHPEVSASMTDSTKDTNLIANCTSTEPEAKC